MHENAPLAPSPRNRSPLAWAILLAVVLGVVAWVFSRIAGIGLMGFDSYPLILSARIESWSDFFGTFSEELMDGRYSGHYYRPLLNLSFALDHLLWGLNPWGYQLTGALLFGACGAAVAWLMSRLLGGKWGLGVLAASLFFLFHDSQFEVLPVPARRPELLCGLFACLSLASQLREKSLARHWPVVPALWMLLAGAAKETGYVLPLISVLAVCCYSPASTFRERGRQALRAGALHALLLGSLLAVRTGVLGGLGGPAPLPQGFVGPSSLELSGLLFKRLFVPQNVAAWGASVPLVAGLAGLSLLLACRVAGARRAALWCAASWIVVVGLLYGISRSIEQWYLFLPVIGLALLVGAGADLLAAAWRAGGQARQVRVSLGALALAAFCFCQVRYTPLIHAYPEWKVASAASAEFFEKLERRVERSAPGAVIKAPPIPVWYPPPQAGPGIRGAAILDDYSVQAWLELKHPDRLFRVLKGPPSQALAPDESAVQLLRAFDFEDGRKP